MLPGYRCHLSQFQNIVKIGTNGKLQYKREGYKAHTGK